MDHEMIIKDIKEYIEQSQVVTVFQVMAEKGYSYLDVRKTFDLCINEGFITGNEDTYSVVPKNKRISIQEKLRRKIERILDALFEKEIDFLKEATDERSLSQMESYCRNNATPFLHFIHHFLEVHLFIKDAGDYRLALNEQEYLLFWDLLGEYPKKKNHVKKHTRKTPAPIDQTKDINATQMDFFKRMEKPDLFADEKESVDGEEGDNAALPAYVDDQAVSNHASDIDDDIEPEDDTFAIIEIRRHILENKDHSRLELIADIQETLADEGAFGSFRCEFLKMAIQDLKKMDDQTFKKIKKQYIGS